MDIANSSFSFSASSNCFFKLSTSLLATRSACSCAAATFSRIAAISLLWWYSAWFRASNSFFFSSPFLASSFACLASSSFFSTSALFSFSSWFTLASFVASSAFVLSVSSEDTFITGVSAFANCAFTLSNSLSFSPRFIAISSFSFSASSN